MKIINTKYQSMVEHNGKTYSNVVYTNKDFGNEEDKDFLSEQLITYIGNKRKLIKFIEKAILKAKNDLKKDKLFMFDEMA